MNRLRWRQGKATLAVYGGPADLLLLPEARRHAIGSTQARRVLVPGGAVERFHRAEALWKDFAERGRLHDYENQTTRWPGESLPQAEAVVAGAALAFGGAPIDVLATPGYTREGLSFGWVADGQRVLATGSLLQAGGKLLDLCSLQEAIPELKVRGYHGHAARIAVLLESIARIRAWKPDWIFPASGDVVTDPMGDLRRLEERLLEYYANYLSTDAYRWYVPAENTAARARRVLKDRPYAPMPFAETRQQMPEWMRAQGNSRLIVAPDGHAVLIDCGMNSVPPQLRRWQSEGVFRKLDAIYVTHYHDDHTDHVSKTAEEFGAAVWTCAGQAEVLREPERFRLPCLTHSPIAKLDVWRHKESRAWHGFQLTSFDFPGQTLFHGALLAAPPQGDAVLFVGDSFTPSGMDDYCLLNRNLVGKDVGLDLCLRLVEEMGRPWLVNQHVGPLFRFSGEQIRIQIQRLEQRRGILEQLSVLPGANFAVDEQWVRLDPYVATAKRGERLSIRAVVRNHGSGPADFRCTLRIPAGWDCRRRQQSIRVGAGQESFCVFDVVVQSAGVPVLSVDRGGARFFEWAECIVKIS